MLGYLAANENEKNEIGVRFMRFRCVVAGPRQGEAGLFDTPPPGSDNSTEIRAHDLSLMDNQNAEHTIQLLRVLLVMSPDDAGRRLELLSLLHARGEADEFTREARNFQARHPDDHRAWARICVMGRDLAPYDIGFSAPAEPPADANPTAGTTGAVQTAQVVDLEQERRKYERRRHERRETVVEWRDDKRSRKERRQHVRREVDLIYLT